MFVGKGKEGENNMSYSNTEALQRYIDATN